MKQSILVTGGAGYIGSHVCKALALAGYEPVTYDNLSTGHRDFVRWGPFVHGDILDSVRLGQALAGHKACGVIHLAALAYVGESVSAPDQYYHTNVGGTLSLLRAMREKEVPHIVVSSTCAVYGQPENMPINESCPCNPVNPYGFTKLAMERMLDDFERAFGISGACLRYFNAAGADGHDPIGERHDPETHLLPRVIMATHGAIAELHIFGNDYPTPDGTCVRDYVHVSDLADAHVRALQRLAAGKPSFKVNLGTGRGYSVREMVLGAQQLFGRAVPHAFHPRRAGDPPVLVADASLAGQLLDWRPRFSDLENLLRTAADFEARYLAG